MAKQSVHDFEALVRRCRLGDDDAWHKLIARFRALVRSIAARAGLSQDEAEDVFQFTVIALFDGLPKIQSATGLPKWIATTAARECGRMRRLRGSQTLSIEALDSNVSQEPSPEDLAIRSIMKRDLQRALARLPEREMTLLHQLFVEECCYKEAAKECAMSVGAIGPTRSRALRRLRESMTRMSS